MRQLARAGFRRAEQWRRWENGTRMGMLVCGLGALAVVDWPAYLLSLIALLLEAGSWVLRRKSISAHDLAEQASRRALLVDAFGETKEPLDVLELRRQFSAKTTRKAQTVEIANYYSSEQGPGLARLRDHLQESAFWSHHLYEMASRRAIVFVVVLVLAVLVAALLALPAASGDTPLLLARVLVLILGTIVGVDALGRGLAWRTAAAQAGTVVRRLQKVDLTDQEPCLAVFGDYAAATATAPAIPERLYAAEQERLNQLWNNYRDGRT